MMILLATVSTAAPEVVPAVDLKRYAGRWHEIARLPNRFQRDCEVNVTATYTLRPDGKIAVLNECGAAGGRTKSARGTARIASKEGPNTKLKVSFFWPFSGDYWIIGLDPDYRWALVGGPGRDYLWILSREPSMDEDLYGRVVDLAERRGYDVSRLLRTSRS